LSPCTSTKSAEPIRATDGLSKKTSYCKWRPTGRHFLDRRPWIPAHFPVFGYSRQQELLLVPRAIPNAARGFSTRRFYNSALCPSRSIKHLAHLCEASPVQISSRRYPSSCGWSLTLAISLLGPVRLGPHLQ
jgi:hypothetical protein